MILGSYSDPENSTSKYSDLLFGRKCLTGHSLMETPRFPTHPKPQFDVATPKLPGLTPMSATLKNTTIQSSLNVYNNQNRAINFNKVDHTVYSVDDLCSCS